MFGFNDNQPAFNARFYISNLLKFFILSFIALTVHNWIQKYYSDKVGSTTELAIWSSTRRVIGTKRKFSIPFGAIAPILITLLSAGQLFFPAVTSTKILVKPAYRLGRKYTRLTEFEHAKIAAIAPLLHILISIVLNFIDIPILKEFALVNTMMAISYMLPIPGLLGATVFFSSKPLYIFSAVFILIAALLLELLSGFYTFLAAIVIAVLLLILYLWQFYKKG